MSTVFHHIGTIVNMMRKLEIGMMDDGEMRAKTAERVK
jgi:hypothetical protein